MESISVPRNPLSPENRKNPKGGNPRDRRRVVKRCRITGRECRRAATRLLENSPKDWDYSMKNERGSILESNRRRWECLNLLRRHTDEGSVQILETLAKLLRLNNSSIRIDGI